MEPKPFIVRYRPDGARKGRVWQVLQGKNWRSAAEVTILAHPVITQPDGAIVGDGIVTTTSRGHITIYP